MMVSRSLWCAAVAGGAFSLLSCGDGPTGGDEPGPPAAIVSVSGNNQEATVGTELPNPLVVRVEDADGNPVPGQLVNFRVTAGGGSVFAGASITNAQGIVQERWTVGTVAGATQTLEARAVDNSSGAALVIASFSATARAGPPNNIEKVSGDGQTGNAGAAVAQPVVVKVTDQYGNPVANVAVTWNVTAGGGSVASATTNTNAEGLAQVAWTLGTGVGPNTVTASVANLTAQTFTATARAATASQLTLEAGGGQTATVNSLLPEQLRFRVTDQFNNPVQGVVITLSGDGIFPSPFSTNAEGRAIASWQLGTVAGPQQISASAPGTNTVNVTATANPGSPAAVVIVSGNQQSGAAGQQLAQPLVARVRDQFNNSVPNIQLQWVVSSNCGSVSPTQSTTDANGMAQTNWTVGTVASQCNGGVDARVTANLSVRFTASITGTGATTISARHLTDQVGIIDQPTQLIAWVADGSGNPVPNVNVSWTMTSGNGTLSAPSSATDVNGQAAVQFTPGRVSGHNFVRAAAGGIGTADYLVWTRHLAPARIVVVSGDGQTGPIGDPLANPIVVKVEDQYGNGAYAEIVDVSVTASSGFVQRDSVYTDSLGRLSMRWVPGSSGANSMTVSSNGSSTTVNATGTTALGRRIFIVAGNEQRFATPILAPSTSPMGPITVQVRDPSGAPAAGVDVQWNTQLNGGTGTTDASGNFTFTGSFVPGLPGKKPVTLRLTTGEQTTGQAFEVGPGGNITCHARSGRDQTGKVETRLADKLVVHCIGRYAVSLTTMITPTVNGGFIFRAPGYGNPGDQPWYWVMPSTPGSYMFNTPTPGAPNFTTATAVP